jgi:multidrug efflux pump subunit AcrA (membrane-fusion protein)
MSEIFRKEALQRLSSPERLDQLMHVVSPHDWLVLGTVLVLLGLALTWAGVGRLSTTVAGRGVLIRPRKVVEWQAPAAGRLATLTVSVGDVVQKGAVLGTIDHDDCTSNSGGSQLRDLLARTAQDFGSNRALAASADSPEQASSCNSRMCATAARCGGQSASPQSWLDNRRRLETLGLARASRRNGCKPNRPHRQSE